MISSDQRSPIISRDALTGQPERRFGLGFLGIAGHDNKDNLQNASESADHKQRSAPPLKLSFELGFEPVADIRRSEFPRETTH